MQHVVTQLTGMLGVTLDPSQRNLLSVIVCTVLYAIFVNRGK